jgi:signal transduction histidine kinase
VSTGLGLYVVRGLVEAHGGTVHVEDSIGGGARFVVELCGGIPGHVA